MVKVDVRNYSSIEEYILNKMYKKYGDVANGVVIKHLKLIPIIDNGKATFKLRVDYFLDVKKGMMENKFTTFEIEVVNEPKNMYELQIMDKAFNDAIRGVQSGYNIDGDRIDSVMSVDRSIFYVVKVLGNTTLKEVARLDNYLKSVEEKPKKLSLQEKLEKLLEVTIISMNTKDSERINKHTKYLLKYSKSTLPTYMKGMFSIKEVTLPLKKINNNPIESLHGHYYQYDNNTYVFVSPLVISVIDKSDNVKTYVMSRLDLENKKRVLKKYLPKRGGYNFEEVVMEYMKVYTNRKNI